MLQKHLFSSKKNDMDKPTIIKQLNENYLAFIAYLDTLTEEQLRYSFDKKWTAGQQLEHIYLSVKPVKLAFILPQFIVRLIGGKATHKSRTYEELVNAYLLVLKNGAKATRSYIPNNSTYPKGTELKTKLKNEIQKLCAYIHQTSEEDLDKLMLPHPLVGKITMREMLYFTIYHVHHHHMATMQNLSHFAAN